MCIHMCASTFVPVHLGFLRQGFSLAWSPLLASEPQDLPAPKLSTGATSADESGGSNSNSCACKASPLPTEPLFSSLKDF